jgi:hypothetical protein
LSRASAMMKTLEYIVATEWRVPEISSFDGRVRLVLCRL